MSGGYGEEGSVIKYGWISGKKILSLWKRMEAELYDAVTQNNIQTYDAKGFKITVKTVGELKSCYYRLEDILPLFPLDELSDWECGIVVEHIPKALKQKYMQQISDSEGPESKTQPDTEKNQDLNAKERRKLGQLRQYEAKFDTALEAMAYAMHFLKDNKGEKVTTDKFMEILYKKYGDRLPHSMYEKIRVTIRDEYPGQYLKENGRPSRQKT